MTNSLKQYTLWDALKTICYTVLTWSSTSFATPTGVKSIATLAGRALAFKLERMVTDHAFGTWLTQQRSSEDIAAPTGFQLHWNVSHQYLWEWSFWWAIIYLCHHMCLLIGLSEAFFVLFRFPWALLCFHSFDENWTLRSLVCGLCRP